mmetsp:Transcript_4954/g.15593  ORF Transcript_4954/g.15593 Transcript_4954/m.15593 type:complete len:734 (+) Transcript_4954:41-2242(+)
MQHYGADGDSAGTGFPSMRIPSTSHNLLSTVTSPNRSPERHPGAVLKLENSRVRRHAGESGARKDSIDRSNSPSPLRRHCSEMGHAVPRVSERGREFPDQPPVHSWHIIGGDQTSEGSSRCGSPGTRVWSRESIASDPKGYLLRMLDPYLPANDARVREQVGAFIAQTLNVVEGVAAANHVRDQARAMETHWEVQEELRAAKEDLQSTERNRAELAKLLEATIQTTQQVATCEGAERRTLGAAVTIQRAWRRCQARRRARRFRASKLVDPYDAIVCFDSLSATLDPACLQIEILRWAHSAFNIGRAERDGIRIVAHMGLFDKGKTFLINQFYGKNLPSGKLHETTGLSMIYLPKQRFLVIDTKGLQAPVSYKTESGVKQLVDASQTEIFMFELVSRIAHYIIFVVNDFTWPEQRHIVQLHQKYVQSKRENQLIVVHNLRTTRSEREAVELFSKQVASKYEGVERSELGGLIFTTDEKPRIHHIGFAEAHSPAGERFNSKNAAHILQLLDQLEGIGERQRSIAELLQEHFASLLPEFVFLEETATGQRFDGSALRLTRNLDFTGGAEQVEPGAERDPTAYRSIGSLVLQVPEDHQVHIKTEGIFSEFCELVAQDITFKPPPPNVYEQHLKDKVVRLVEFEIPGVHRKDIVFKKGNRGLHITMSRAKDKAMSGYGVAPRFQAPRIPTGEFSYDLFFDDGIWELDGGREAVSHENGLLRIRLKQDLNGEVFTLDTL